MADSYANNVDNANEFIRNYKQSVESAAGQAAQTQLEAYYNKLKETRDKYTAEASEGGEEIGGAAAVHMLYGKVKDMYGKYKNFKEPNTPSEEADANEQEDDDGGGEQNIDDAGNRPQGATETEDAPTNAGSAEGMGEGVDTGTTLGGGEFTGRSGLADDAIGSRLQSRVQFLNENFGAPPAGTEPVDASVDALPRNAPEPAAQGGEASGGRVFDPDFDFSYGSFRQGGGYFNEPTEESAFGDTSNIPRAGTASGLQARIDAQQATRVRGGNINRPNGSGAPENGGQARDLGQGGTDGGSQGGLDVNQQAQVGTSSEGSSGISTRGNIQTDSAGGGARTGDLGDDLAPVEEEGGSFLGDIGASVGLDAIPVIGEAAAVIQGLVGIGEGIAHLFSPDAPKPKPNVNAEAMITPAAITSKFSAALPSMDGATEDTAGSMSAF